jgi:hypothetical protein
VGDGGGGSVPLSCVWVGARIGAPLFGTGSCEHAAVSALHLCADWLNSLALGDGDGRGMGVWDGGGVGWVGAWFSV